MGKIEEGLEHTSKTFVNEENTAFAMGSGDMNVFATPELVALMENAAMMAVVPQLEMEETTVGCEINTTHIRPSAVGALIIATATLIKVEGRKLTFHVIAKDGDNVIGEGTHIRFVVNKERFLAKLE